MNNFIMLVGRPGMGKSTFIDLNQLDITANYGVDSVISSDSVIEDVANSRGLTYAEVFKEAIPLAGKYIEAMIGILSLQQRNFILDQTNLTPKSRKHKLNLLTHPQNYNKIAVVFDGVDTAELSRRLNERAKGMGKIIPAEALENMEKGFIYPTVEEGFNKVMTVQEFKDSLVERVNDAPAYGEMKFG